MLNEGLGARGRRFGYVFVSATLLLTVVLVVYSWTSPALSSTSSDSFLHAPEIVVFQPVAEVVKWPIWEGTDLERLAPRITGPRGSKPRVRALLTIPIGKKSVDIVNGTIYSFLNSGAGRVMLFAYDSFDWSSQKWYNDERVILVRHLKQMKWWFIKRFVTPLTVEPYDYLWFSDDDASFSWNPHEFMDLLDAHQVELAQPSHFTHQPCAPSGWPIAHHRSTQNGGGINGRWTNFVECGPLAIVKKTLWKQCLWNFLQDDLTSGYGLDELWHDACKAKSAIIDKYPMCHNSTKAASSASTRIYDPVLEWPEYGKRFPHLKKSPNDPLKNFIGTF